MKTALCHFQALLTYNFFDNQSPLFAIVAMQSFLSAYKVLYLCHPNKVCKYWPKNRLTFEYSNWIRKILHTILLGGIKCQTLTFNVIMLNRLL